MIILQKQHKIYLNIYQIMKIRKINKNYFLKTIKKQFKYSIIYNYLQQLYKKYYNLKYLNKLIKINNLYSNI